MGFLKNLVGGKDSSKKSSSLTIEEERKRAEEKGRIAADASGASLGKDANVGPLLDLLAQWEQQDKDKKAKKERIDREKSEYYEGLPVRTAGLTYDEVKELEKYELHCCLILTKKNFKKVKSDMAMEILGVGLRALLQDHQLTEFRESLLQRLENPKTLKKVPILFDDDDMIEGARYVSNANICFFSDDDYSDDYFAKNIYNKYLFDVTSEVKEDCKIPFDISVFIAFIELI